MPKHKHDPDLLALIGRRIADARRARGMTQAALGEAIGIEPVTLSRYEAGARGPSISTIASVADVLGVNVGVLVDRVRDLPEPRYRPEVEDAIRILEGLDDAQLDLALRLLHEVGR